MLTTEQMQKITEEMLNGKKPTVKGKEADEFRASLAKDVARAKKEKLEIVIPGEW